MKMKFIKLAVYNYAAKTTRTPLEYATHVELDVYIHTVTALAGMGAGLPAPLDNLYS